MNDEEALLLIAKAGLTDARAGRVNADKALAWAEALDDVTLADALAALLEHVKTSPAVVTPFYIRAQVSTMRAAAAEKRHDEQVRLELEEAKDGVPMPDELREAFQRDAKIARAKLRAMYARPLPVKSLTDDERAAKVAAAKAELDERRKQVAS